MEGPRGSKINISSHFYSFVKKKKSNSAHDHAGTTYPKEPGVCECFFSF